MKLSFKRNSVEVSSDALGCFAVLALSEYEPDMANAIWVSSEMTEYTPAEDTLPRIGEIVWSLNIRGRWLMARSLELGMQYVKAMNGIESKAAIESDGEL